MYMDVTIRRLFRLGTIDNSVGVYMDVRAITSDVWSVCVDRDVVCLLWKRVEVFRGTLLRLSSREDGSGFDYISLLGRVPFIGK